MRITTILGSPRTQGNTASVLSGFEARLGPAHVLTRINVAERNVAGCRGCESCQGVFDEPGCVQEDDAQGILQLLTESDVIVYASPIYAWGFPSQMKALLDRHYCLAKWEDERVSQALLAGKRALLLVTCGGTAEANADLAVEMFRRQMAYMGCEVVGEHVVADCTTPEALGEKGEEAADAMTWDIARLAAPRSRSR
jgi:multimeric flavodoxin WrbA